ncbi:hypothetical protein [Hymenobacter guriensis]|uniref:Exo-alpha-sialidase n=1 Tax=Hymenobacter guriensis TaxID=2793065 RepID=A0ABS0KXN4_9BACT|nr:hypothetical protein [Hymenobacter guriensis]MBG8552525.1 hypothetical protein [Hymenobacter guriensis]
MLTTTNLFLAASALLLTTACRKEIETVVVKEVDKVYSWTEIKQAVGTSRYILNMTKDENQLYLQTPYYLGILSPNNKRRYYEQVGAGFPTNIDLRMAMSNVFTAYPVRDTAVTILQTKAPLSGGGRSLEIIPRQLDPKATYVQTNNVRIHGSFAAINRNNYLLFAYSTAAAPDPNVHFILTQLSVQAGQIQAQPLVITAPTPSIFLTGRLRWIVSFDDYFLADMGDAGIYKILQDGTIRLVTVNTPESTIRDACYEWQGRLYIVEEYNSMLVSLDKGVTWRRYTDTPDAFTFTEYYTVGDSLVGISHAGTTNQLFTLRWNNFSYKLRALENDGLERVDISNLAVLGDTVYVGTNGGLFKRPLSAFFETKQ